METSKKKTTNTKIDKVKYYKELNDLHFVVATNFDKCENAIFEAQDAVGYSSLSKATKTNLLKKFQGIWADMREIVDTIGRCGKVK